MLTPEMLKKITQIYNNIDSMFDFQYEVYALFQSEYNRPPIKEEWDEICYHVFDTAAAKQPPDKVSRIKALASRLAATYEQKNAAYGDSFGISVRKYGIIAALTRMSDKWNRLENLILHEETKQGDESVLDTLLDMATYALMTYMELEEPNE